MNKPIITSKKFNTIVKKSDDKLINIFKKSPTVSKFYQQKLGFRPSIQLKTNLKKKRNNTTLQLSCERMVCSEEVSRKKYVKIDDTSKFMKFTSYTLENIENNGDFLDKLKEKCKNDHSNFNMSISRNQQHRKLLLRPKTLLNNESLKLMNNFKEYMKQKEKNIQKNVNIKLPMKNNVSMPFSDNSNYQYSQGTVHQNNDITRNNLSMNILTPSNSQLRNSVEPTTIIEIPVKSNTQIQLLNSPRMTSQSFKIHSERIGIKSISQLPLANPLSFGIDSTDSMNNGDRIIRYPTPPLI